MSVNKKLAVVGCDISEKCARRLSELGFELFVLPPCKSLGKGVDTHADLMLFPIGNSVFIYEDIINTSEGLYECLTSRGYDIKTMSGAPSAEYPFDIGANCLCIGRYIFSKTKYTAREIREYAEKTGYSLVNVNQGYARCTACPVGESAVITADPSIAKSALSQGIELLRISEGGVSLRGFDHGFIGGACGAFEDKLFFAGDILKHPNGDEIVAFCKAHGIEPHSLSDEPLRDIGSIFFF